MLPPNFKQKYDYYIEVKGNRKISGWMLKKQYEKKPVEYWK